MRFQAPQSLSPKGGSHSDDVHDASTLVAIFDGCRSAAVQPANSGSDFSIILLPDVQNESDYYPAVLASETQWIANSQSSLNIQAVLGLGDIVNNGSDNAQWTNADAAMQTLDHAQIPYFLAIGNHDYDNLAPSTRLTVGFNQWFGPARYSQLSVVWRQLQRREREFLRHTEHQRKGLSFPAPGVHSAGCGRQLGRLYLVGESDKEAIVVTHSFLFADGTRVDQCDTQDLNVDNYGDKLWTKLISHASKRQHDRQWTSHPKEGRASRADLGVNGNLDQRDVFELPDAANGGDGYLRILTFHPAAIRSASKHILHS